MRCELNDCERTAIRRVCECAANSDINQQFAALMFSAAALPKFAPRGAHHTFLLLVRPGGSLSRPGGMRVAKKDFPAQM